MKDNSNISQDLLETVERYYNGTMATEERAAFEARLQQDLAFNTQVEDIKTLLIGIETQSLKEKMNEFHDDLPIQMRIDEPSSKVRFLNFRKIAAAAIVIVALGSFWFLNHSGNEQLYNNYFKPDPGLPTTMSSSENFAFFDAMVDYKQGNYQKAISKWEKLHEESPQNDTINYFLGVAYLADDKANIALPYLEHTASRQESVFNKDANYYLGLTYLKNNDIENAKKYLKLSHTENSKKLLKKLN
ncbi:MAG: hypothetical protein R2797_02905 [Gelidibacter sp.]